MDARSHAMEGAVRGGERKRVVGSDDKGLASGCNARDGAINDATGVFFAPEQGLRGGKQDALVAACDEHGSARNAAGAYTGQQVLRVSVDSDDF